MNLDKIRPGFGLDGP